MQQLKQLVRQSGSHLQQLLNRLGEIKENGSNAPEFSNSTKFKLADRHSKGPLPAHVTATNV